MFFSNLFWGDAWQNDVSWKKMEVDYLETPTNKQVKFVTITRLSSRVENPTSRMANGYSIFY